MMTNNNEFQEIGLHKKYEDFEDTIDLLALFLKIKSYWYIVVTGILVGALIAVSYATFFKTSYYESSSMVYIRSSNSTISLQDLQVSATLTNDYEVIFKSRPNLEKVIDNLSLNYSYEQLYSMITTTNPTETRILKISVQSPDPNLSKKIVNEVVKYGMNSIREIDSQEPYLLESAIANPQKIGSSTLKTCAIGAMAGMVVTLGAIFLFFMLNDHISSIDDVERTLGVPVLALVVEDEKLTYAKRKVKKKVGFRNEHCN